MSTKWWRTLSDQALIAEREYLEQQYDRMVAALEESDGAAGDPLEGLPEEIAAIGAELRRRQRIA